VTDLGYVSHLSEAPSEIGTPQENSQALHNARRPRPGTPHLLVKGERSTAGLNGERHPANPEKVVYV
jgi:hypothetical protein